MAPESASVRKRRAQRIFTLLADEFPEPQTALHHRNSFELLIATLLSAQCTDERVNKVTPALFKAGPDAQTMFRLGEDRIRELVRSINFFKTKARNIHLTSQRIIEVYGGKVPSTLNDLVSLPGIGQKTANVVLGNIFNTPRVVVDTHVRRIANRLELTENLDPLRIESDLEKVFEREQWVDSSHLFIFHGRKTCLARSPKCPQCILAKLCPSRMKEANEWKNARTS